MPILIALALLIAAAAAFYRFVPRRRKLVIARVGIATVALAFFAVDAAKRFVLREG